MTRRIRWQSFVVVVAGAVGLAGLLAAEAQDRSPQGGELIFLVPSEPLSSDGHAEGTFDDLCVTQARAVDPEERKGHPRAFDKRLLDEEAYSLYTLRWHRIIPHSSTVRGWTITPAHFLNQQLDTVWLAE